MKIQLDINVEYVEDGPEMTHNTYAIVDTLMSQSIERQLETSEAGDIVTEKAYRSALLDLLGAHKQVD
jgi:hypothetical protein